MNNSIFKKTDFVLCEVPAPEDYPQSQTHSGIALYEDKLLLSSSPYPEERDMRKRAFKKIIRKLTGGRLGKLTNGEWYENPCLYVGKASAAEYPTVFLPIYDNPLMPTPEVYKGMASYNSDPQVFVDKDEVCVFNRTIRRESFFENGFQKYHYLTDLYKIDGEFTGNSFIKKEVSLFRKFTNPCISPTIHKLGDRYIFIYIDSCSYNDGHSYNGIYWFESSTLDGLKIASEIHKVEITGANVLPWHLSLFDYRGSLYTVIACVEYGKKNHCVQMLGEFNHDLSECNIFKTPLTLLNSYRGAAYVDSNDVFVLYSTTVNEFFKDDKSVDGRNIIMVKMSFLKLLGEIQSRS